jgi:hypothetical protein
LATFEHVKKRIKDNIRTVHYQKFQSFVAVPSITTQQQENVQMCMCYIMVYKIGILGNLLIAHNSLWVLAVMFIEKKFEFEEVLHCTYGV